MMNLSLPAVLRMAFTTQFVLNWRAVEDRPARPSSLPLLNTSSQAANRIGVELETRSWKTRRVVGTYNCIRDVEQY